MKKIIILLVLSLSLFTASCSSKPAEVTPKAPEMHQLHSICEMATLKCYYHNVAKSTKAPEKGLTHIGEKERAFWIEYMGIANIGIDMTEVTMEVSGDKVKVHLPDAKLLNVSIDEKKIDKNSFIEAKDSWNSNPITAEDTTGAIKKAQDEMIKEVEKNKGLLLSARDRAQSLIESYIKQMGALSDIDYKIIWEYEK